MKQIVLGTKNKDKLKELQSLFKSRGVRVLSLKDFPQCPEAIENGKTFEANALKKARAYSRHTKSLTLADDSGLMVSALRGMPGVDSAYYAGRGCTYADNNQKLLKTLAKKTSKSARRAKFVSVIAICESGKTLKTVRGECRGSIAFSERGKNGFGYDPVFVPEGFSKTYAELPRTVKNRISHRGKALRKAVKFIKTYLR